MIDKKKIPAHIAIIMDGNGRWARKRGLPRTEGHRRGLKVIKEIIKVAAGLSVKVLTLYAFSTENWKRPGDEVDFLMKSCESFLNQELPSLVKNNIRLRHIGVMQELPVALQKCLTNAMQVTRNNNKLTIQLAFNYGSRREITEAVKRIARECKDGVISADEITESVISDNLYTKGVCDPDLLIRTSGELRVSNFLLWQIAYSEIFVTKKYWPDFSRSEFIRAIKDFQKRQRRFGGVDD